MKIPHAPLPWRTGQIYDPSAKEGRWKIEILSGSDANGSVDIPASVYGATKEEAEANARLLIGLAAAQAARPAAPCPKCNDRGYWSAQGTNAICTCTCAIGRRFRLAK